MTQPCKTCPTPNACEICNLCAYRDMEVIERAMSRMNAQQQPEWASGPDLWVAIIIVMAFGVWFFSMLVKTGVAW